MADGSGSGRDGGHCGVCLGKRWKSLPCSEARGNLYFSGNDSLARATTHTGSEGEIDQKSKDRTKPLTLESNAPSSQNAKKQLLSEHFANFGS